MPGPYSIFYNPDAPAGERLSPEIREEIAEVAPSVVDDGSITEAKLAPESVTEEKYGDDSIPERAYEDDSIPTRAYAPESVDSAALGPDSVIPSKCGTGVVTAKDATGTNIESTEWYGSAAEYAAITTKDPNTTYNTWA